MIAVEVERCRGCGACVEACSVGAASLVDGVVRIDGDLCTECGACSEICPEGAIHIAKPVAVQTETTSVAAPTSSIAIDRRHSAMGAILGTTMTFLGREVAPRLASSLMAALDQRLMDRSTSTSAVSPNPRAGGHRRRRQRGGRGTRRDKVA